MLRCLVINLQRSPDRLAHIRSSFAALGASFERMDAVDGVELSEQTVAHINAANRWIRPLVRAEIGCLLSHRACWQSIATGNAPFAAIFEDDVHLSAAAAPLLRSSDWIPDTADLIKLETRGRRVVVSRKSLQATPLHRLVRLFSFHDGLAGYVVSRRCALWLHEQAEHCVAPADQVVMNPDFGLFPSLQVWQLTPSVCIPDQFVQQRDGTNMLASTIDTDGKLYRTDDMALKPWRRASRRLISPRALQRIAEGAQRLLQGRKRMRIEYR
jgi:glycosyl transferase, family 25